MIVMMLAHTGLGVTRVEPPKVGPRRYHTKRLREPDHEAATWLDEKQGHDADDQKARIHIHCTVRCR